MPISSPPDLGGAAPFAEPWQAQAFALTVELHAKGAFTWSEWSRTLGAQIAAEDGADYYERWLAALETILAAKGLADPASLAALKSAWARAYRDTPHGKPVAL
jgi:nitrile hydratase accessory protein